MVRTTTDEDEARIDPDDVDFDAHAIAAAWEAAPDIPVYVAVAVTNEFHDLDVKALEGYKTDGDVGFWEDPDDGTPVVLFEEKAVGVCPRETAKKFAPMFVDLPNRDDDRVLAVNPAQIFN